MEEDEIHQNFTVLSGSMNWSQFMLKALDVIFGPASADSPINNLIQHFIFPFYSETFNLKTTLYFQLFSFKSILSVVQ